MYLVDANIFLELELDQHRAEECASFLRLVRDGHISGFVTNLIVDSIVLIMEDKNKHPKDILKFLASLLAYKSLQIYDLSLADKIRATETMEAHHLDFDDSTTYQAMKRLGITQIVSYDKHFDRLPNIERLQPTSIKH